MITNQAHITNMRLEIPDANTTVHFVSSAQSVTLPSIEMELSRVSTNQMGMGMMPGSKINYEPVRIRFLIDEEFKSYQEIYQWIISITDSRSFNSTAHLPGMRPMSMLIHILDNHKRKIVMTMKLNNPFPYSIDELEMGYTEEGNPALFSMVSFGYSSFSLLSGNNGVEILPKTEQVGTPSFHPSIR
ncbi:tail tube terminator protein [Aeromonas phage avDM6]|nr:tail tube terminator protein [Aeromonas phage avDM6]